MDAALERQMVSWDGNKGDRLDPVAIALRRLYLRVELCPCSSRPRRTRCRQCELDCDAIEAAWAVPAVPRRGEGA